MKQNNTANQFPIIIECNIKDFQVIRELVASSIVNFDGWSEGREEIKYSLFKNALPIQNLFIKVRKNEKQNNNRQQNTR